LSKIYKNLEFHSKSLSKEYVAYQSTATRAKTCYRWWKYGKYLEKRNSFSLQLLLDGTKIE